MQPADVRLGEDEVARRLIEASLDLLAKGGWADFSLRAVAESIGAAGSAASHRFGDRAGLVTAVGDAVLSREAAWMDGFLPGASASGPDDLASLLYEWLDQRVRADRRQTRTCAELLLVSAQDPQFSDFGPRWRGLCRGLIERLDPDITEGAARDLAAFLTVDIPFWLLLADDPEFRLESQEGLRRMARGLHGDLPVCWLERGLAAAPAPLPAALSGTKLKIARATADLIAESGAQSVTHRRIAQHCGASLSSLTYHFESLEDLIRQGFQTLFAGPGHPPPVAVYDLCLRALHDPSLTPLAASVRRRLGQGAPSDLAAGARREAAVILAAAQVLTGDVRGGAAGLRSDRTEAPRAADAI